MEEGDNIGGGLIINILSSINSMAKRERYIISC